MKINSENNKLSKEITELGYTYKTQRNTIKNEYNLKPGLKVALKSDHPLEAFNLFFSPDSFVALLMSNTKSKNESLKLIKNIDVRLLYRATLPLFCWVALSNYQEKKCTLENITRWKGSILIFLFLLQINWGIARFYLQLISMLSQKHSMTHLSRIGIHPSNVSCSSKIKIFGVKWSIWNIWEI